LRVTAELITRRGVDGVQFAEVAAAAGVTRPLVYKFFPSRQALIIAVLEDYAGALTERFGRRSLDTIPGGVEDVALVFVEAVADTIESYGAGPWHLLDSKGPDPDVARRGQAIMDQLMAPWRAQMAVRLHISPRAAATLARMIVAAGRAALELWCAGRLSRAEAVRDSTRGVSALLQAFAAPPGRRRPRRA
ncbi:MAG: TetR/AcrR family transcriptional regulator, partial [Candidatus Binatia bacterium]